MAAESKRNPDVRGAAARNAEKSGERRSPRMLTASSALRVIALDVIQTDPSYQREIVPKHKKIVAEFNEEALGIPVVGQREDGSLWIVDGLQRLTALRKLERKTVRAEVFVSRGPEHEAEVFRLINQNRTKLKSAELFHALLASGDEVAWVVKKTAESLGFQLTTSTRQRNSGKSLGDAERNAKLLTAVSALYNIAKTSGAEGIKFVLTTIDHGWPADPMGNKAEILTGIYLWWMRREKVVDQDRLIARLKVTPATKVWQQAMLGIGSRPTNVAEVIEKVYRRVKSAKEKKSESE